VNGVGFKCRVVVSKRSRTLTDFCRAYGSGVWSSESGSSQFRYGKLN
jgi:hypothetical protein